MSEEEKPDYEVLAKQWEKEVMENPAVQEYCKPYNSASLKYFCTAYARTKSFGLQFGEMYREINEEKENEWIDAGYDHLCIMQQKKLFDANCLWRAEQLQIEEVEVCFDFDVWEKDVLNCPFIEQITQQEVDWYCEYLLQNNIELEQGWLENWQDYEEIKEAYEKDSGNRNVPEWYEFHNGKTGNGMLMILPDIRGEKEDFYRKLVHEAELKKDTQQHSVKDPESGKPWMQTYSTDLHLEVAELIEDKHTLVLMQEYVKATEHHRTYESERADEDLRYLSNIKDELVPIEAHHDYRVALSLAVESYKCRKIAEHLPFAFQKYNRMRAMGFELGTEKEKENFKSSQQIGRYGREKILQGRALNGEPGDFNF